MTVFFTIPWMFIIVIALAALAFGFETVSVIVTFVLKYFWIISIVLWLGLYGFVSMIMEAEEFDANKLKGLPRKLYAGLNTLPFLPLYMVFYEGLRELNECVIKVKIISLIMDLVGGFFTMAIAFFAGFGIIYLGNLLWDKGKKKTAVAVELVLTFLCSALVFLVYFA